MKAITNFSGEYAFLSNFFPCSITYKKITYKSVEHAFQAAKTKDLDKRREIASLATPGQAKRAGRKLVLRPNWDKKKDNIMLDLLEIKFSDPDLIEMLELTGDVDLIEGNNWHDNYWGNCYCFQCESIVGLNRLGELIMEVRDELNL